MTNSKELPAPGGQADGAYYNVWLTIPKVDAGVMTNQARAKLSYGGWLEPGAPIVFTIMSGSAVFAGGLKTTTVTTDSFGCAYVAFSDTGTDAGEMKAAMQNNTDVSDKAPYSFGGGTSSGFNIALSAIVDDAPADGTSDDQGRALVTYGGGPLQDRQNVQFVFGAGSSAVFETDKSDVQAGSTGSKLIVKTHLDEQGNDIADAYFHDTSGEQVTLIATLVDHPEVPAGTLDFTFTAAAPTFDIELNRVTDGAPADGSSEDQGRAVVTENGGPLQAPKIVKFSCETGSSARFDTTKPQGYVQSNSSSTVLYVKTHFDSDAQKDIADAYLMDNVAETVTLYAALEAGNPWPVRSLGFQFVAPASPPTYDLALYWITTDDTVFADGISENLARAVVSCSDATRQQEQIVKFELAPGSSASFNIKGSSYIQPNSTSTVLYVKSRALFGYHIAEACFADTVPEKVTVKASLVGHPEVKPQSQQCEFAVPPNMSYALVSLTRDGQPADGKSEIHARMILMADGKPYTDWRHPCPRFECMMGSAKFDMTKPTGDYGSVQPNSSSKMLYVAGRYVEELGQVVADAYFTDTFAEWVIIQVYIPGVGSPSSSKYFTFYDVPD